MNSERLAPFFLAASSTASKIVSGTMMLINLKISKFRLVSTPQSLAGKSLKCALLCVTKTCTSAVKANSIIQSSSGSFEIGRKRRMEAWHTDAAMRSSKNQRISRLANRPEPILEQGPPHTPKLQPSRDAKQSFCHHEFMKQGIRSSIP